MPGDACAIRSSASATGARANRCGWSRSCWPRRRVPDTKPIQYRIVDRSSHDRAGERERVVEGLFASPARIEPKYLYDELGCALYGAICQLPEYYPTRTEVALFREHRDAIAQALGRGRQFVDLGAGDCCKAQAWLPYVSPARYIPI